MTRRRLPYSDETSAGLRAWAREEGALVRGAIGPPDTQILGTGYFLSEIEALLRKVVPVPDTTAQQALTPRQIRELFANFHLNDSAGACLLEDARSGRRFGVRRIAIDATEQNRNEPIVLTAVPVTAERPAYSAMRLYQIFGGIAAQNPLTVRVEDDPYSIVSLVISPDPAIGGVLKIVPQGGPS
jgi:hypothetical protein